MNLKVIFCAFIICLTNTVSAQDAMMKTYGDMLIPADLKEYLGILASDAMEGRETGKRGQKMAATFIRSHYEELGLAGPVNGSYYQPFELYTTVQGDTYVKCGDVKFKNFQDFVYYGNADSGGEVSTPVIFAGKARPEDLSQINVEGKGAIVILGAEDSFRGPYDALRAKGAKMVFFFNPNPD